MHSPATSNIQLLSGFGSRRSSGLALVHLTMFLSLTGALGTARANAGAPGSEPVSRRHAGLAEQSLQALDVAGVSLSVQHVSEVLSKECPEAVGPLVGALTHFGVRWTPRRPGPLGRGKFAATYTVYSQNRDSAETDLQGLSNSLAKPFRRLREAYFEAPIAGRLRLKVGKVDANTEFAVLENGSDFSNASFGVSPTLFTMPSYPYGATSANAFASLTKFLTVGLGVYRIPGGSLYSVGEGGIRWGRKRLGRVAVGGWHQGVTRYAENNQPATAGMYALYEQTLVARSGERGLRAFARLSTAQKSVAPASAHAAYGVTWTGFRNRHNDALGFALLDLVPVRFEQALVRTERAIEAYYKLRLNRHAQIKVDLQHIRTPGGVPGARPVAVASVRLLVHASTPTAE